MPLKAREPRVSQSALESTVWTTTISPSVATAAAAPDSRTNVGPVRTARATATAHPDQDRRQKRELARRG